MEYTNFSEKCIPYWNCPTKVLELKVHDISEQIERINSMPGDVLDFINATRIIATLSEAKRCIQNQIEERKKQ
jgi:hypothetical protein